MKKFRVFFQTRRKENGVVVDPYVFDTFNITVEGIDEDDVRLTLEREHGYVMIFSINPAT